MCVPDAEPPTNPTPPSTLSNPLPNADNSILEEVQRQSRELELFQQIRTAMFYSLDPDRLFEVIVGNIAAGFSFKLVSIYLIENNELKMKAQQGYQNYYEIIPLDKGINGKVARTGEAVFLTSLSNQPDIDYLEAMEGVDSQICVPLINRGQEVLGTLSIEAYSTSPLNQRDFQLCLALAEQLVLVVEHALSFKREQRRSHQLSLLNQVGRDLAATLDVPTIIDRVSGPVRQSLGLGSVNIGLVEGEELVYRRGAGSNMREEIIHRALKIDCVSCHCVNTGEFALLNDVSHAVGYLPISNEVEVKSQVVVPLRAEGRILGVIEVESNRLYAFDDDDVILLKTLADQTSIALTNALRFERLQRQSAELSQKNVALAEAVRLKSEFVANVSHELRTPLNSIIGYMDMLRDGFYGEVSEGFNDPIERISRNSSQLLNLINAVLDLSTMESGKLQLEADQLFLPELIEVVYEATLQQATLKELKYTYAVDPQAPFLVTNDLARLRQVLQNLASNAIKFTRKGYVKLEVKSAPPGVLPNYDGECYRILVSDSGIGIAENEFEHIFEKFRQVDGSATREFGGTGLGLTICRRIVGLMHGTLTVESLPGVGSTFTLTLPTQINSLD